MCYESLDLPQHVYGDDYTRGVCGCKNLQSRPFQFGGVKSELEAIP